MKKILAVLVIVLFTTATYAQWSTSGTGPNIYNTTLAGNLGIGTASPTQNIHVVHATKANIQCEANYNGTPGLGTPVTISAIQLRDPVLNQGFAMAFRRSNEGSGNFTDVLQTCLLSISPSVPAEFMYFRYDTQKWQMRTGVKLAEFINTGDVLFNNTNADNGGVGRVGIGVADPANFKAGVKFQVEGGAYVAGRVRCHEVEVALAATFVWPDYVFSSDYKLPSLYDVENFINANNHLEGVPSQAEVANDGVKLGEMNATLLRKVEELTLYMINLQKENDALKVRVSNLEK